MKSAVLILENVTFVEESISFAFVVPPSKIDYHHLNESL